MVAGPVVAGDAGAVQAEDHGLAVEADVVHDLVDGPGHEGGVDGDHRSQPAHGHAGRCRHGVLLGDADVEEAVGVLLLEREQAGGVGHGGGDGHHLGPLGGLAHQRLGEGGGERAGLGLGRVVQPLDGVVLGRCVAPALLGEHVHHVRAAQLGGVAQRLLEAPHVVAVERAGVADAERLEEGGRLPHLAHGGLGGLDAPLEAIADDGHLGHHLLEAGLAAHVGGVVADLGQRLAELRHRRGVGAAVVVQDDDAVAAAVAEVVEALEGHAAGHRPVADDGHDAPAVALLGGLGHGQAVGVAEDRGGVGVLDPVVLGLVAAGVARHAAGLAELVEALPPPGDDLVDVGLVAGVPQEDVAGRVEHPVQGEGELDDAEVGAEVATVLGDRVDDELADLEGEDVQLLVGEGLEVLGGRDRLDDHRGSTAFVGAGSGGRRPATMGTRQPYRRPARRAMISARPSRVAARRGPWRHLR